jgi:hypothetical protein
MPGRRNYSAERARHNALAPEKQRAIYDLLKSQLPEREEALIGWDTILRWLHQHLGLRRPNGGSLTVRQLRRWRAECSCPIIAGTRTTTGRLTPPLSTSFALTAWTLSRFSTADRRLFAVATPETPSWQGRRPASAMPRNGRRAGIGRGRWVRPLAVVRLPPSAPESASSLQADH